MKIIAFFDRWLNRIFFPLECVEICSKYEIEYNTITEYQGILVRSLGNGWFKILDDE